MNRAADGGRVELAIVGLACRFPGAGDPLAFWRNLCAGRESIAELDPRRLREAGVSDAVFAHPDYIRRSPVLEDIESFDARFFGIPAREALLLDPQHRLLLEVGYAALEDAGHVRSAQRAMTGVFACGGGITTSYLQHFGARLDPEHQETASLVHLGNDKDFLATRLSFKLNLTGPSMTVQTACSSSLVALHLACNALRLGEIDIGLVGASAIRIPHHVGYVRGQSPLLSLDGRCSPFSAEASGTVFGSGVAAVVVRRLADALRDGDHVYAVIKSTQVNNDGAMKIGYTASSVPGQAKAMVRAMAGADTDARRISYVECHGTATKIGDPLEIKALEKAFRLDTDDQGFCAIGSVKSNIGHLEQAAGLASLIKVALMLRHDTLVPSLNYHQANPNIDFERSPFRVVTGTAPWSATLGQGATEPRLAAINCLGIGGTNAFSILQSPPDNPEEVPAAVTGLPVCLSARTREQLQAYLQRFADFCREHPDLDRRALAHTLNISRAHHRERLAAVLAPEMDLATFFEEAVRRLADLPPTFTPRRLLYVCDQPLALDEVALGAFLAAPRHLRLAEDYRAALERLAGATSSVALEAQRRALAFEVALYQQLRRWGLVFEQVVDVGFGRWVRRYLEAEAALEQAPRGFETLLQALAAAGAEPVPDALTWAHPLATLVISRQAGVPAHPEVGRWLALTGGLLSSDDMDRLVCKVLEAGVEFDWDSYYSGSRQLRLSLPTYPFALERHWPDPASQQEEP